MAKDKDDDFIEALDTAAKRLLEKAALSAKVEGDTPAPATLAEQVRAFQAVSDWAETRRELKPTPKKDSPFDDIRSKFAGAAPERGRGSRRAKAPKADGCGDAAEPATVEPDAGADDLFGAEST